ncbi:UNVERIFIED_ORG: hypothetical protein M2402_004877 [Rahnella aquatilis]
MEISKLNIDKIVIHQIHQRDSEGNKVPPTKSTEYINFDQSALDSFKSRVIDALGEGSKAVEMKILQQEEEYLPHIISEIINKENAEYIDTSYKIAHKLADSQTRRSIPGGIIVIFSGKYGANNRSFVGIIKADVHSAYEKVTDSQTNKISLKFVEEVLLTPSTKLYKTAGFFQTKNAITDDLNDSWDVMISDYQISKSDGKAAAHYFYSDFLGCCYPESSARTTKEFYDVTNKFLNEIDISDEDRNDLHNALKTYLKHEKSSIVSPKEYAERFFDNDVKDSFLEYIDEAGLPLTAFTKDLELIASKLKTRRINFSKNIKLSAPADVFKDYITIESIDVEKDGKMYTWTNVTIKDKITLQE